MAVADARPRPRRKHVSSPEDQAWTGQQMDELLRRAREMHARVQAEKGNVQS